MSDQLFWTTEKRKVSDLRGMPNNPRKATKEQAEQLQESLQKFNLVEIPAIDQDNTIIAGHFRISSLIALGRGEEEIEVRVPNRPLTLEEREEYALRSNVNTGEWNWDLLANFDTDLLKDVGFTDEELEEGLGLANDLDEDEEKCECSICGNKHSIK